MILYTKDWDGKITKNDGSKYYFLKALKGILPEKRDKNWHFRFSILFRMMKPSEGCKYIHANLEKPLSIESTAKEFGMSTRTLSRNLKKFWA
jgi:AraC-like DNA-binding protein